MKSSLCRRSIFFSLLVTTACMALLGLGAIGCAEVAAEPSEQTAKPKAPQLTEDGAPAHLAKPPDNPRAAINKALASGDLKNTGDDQAFLKKMLEITAVPEASQVLVFSLTSHQDAIISRTNPRAIYFSDDCYIGFVPGGVIEYSDVDPEVGTGFFVLDQTEQSPLVLQNTESCLICHEGGRTDYNRGLMVRSVFVRDNGFPYTDSGSFMVSHDTPMEHRWGGWYVTGEHGKIRHMGNVVATQETPGQRAVVDREAGANVQDLSVYFNQSKYLAPGSDIVALMVLEHQVVMHNMLTQGGIVVNEQTARSRSIAEQLGETFDPAGSDTLQTVIKSRAGKIIKHMLFVEEVALESPVKGDDAFMVQFRANRRDDDAGRSLKDFDLATRMFTYRCSYMIYSRAFREMPDLLKDAVYARLAAGLKPDSTDELFEHLGTEEREAIAAILRQTHAGFAAHIGAPIDEADDAE